MKNILLVSIIGLTMYSCTNINDVKKEYEFGNPVARELLLNGYNRVIDEKIDGSILKKALKGNEECKLIVLAQMEALRGIPSDKVRHAPIIVPIRPGKQ